MVDLAIRLSPTSRCAWVTHRTNTLPGSPREAEVRPHSRFCSLGVPDWDGKPPGNLALEGQWGFISGVQEDWGNRIEFTPSKYSISQTPGSRTEAVIRQEPGQPSCWSWSTMRGQAAIMLTVEHRNRAAVLGSSLYHLALVLVAPAWVLP